MKIFIFLSMLSFAAGTAEAQSILKIELTRPEPITVELDGRRFRRSAERLTIGNLPSGQHYIRVYRVKPYRNERGGHATLAFSGRIGLPDYKIVNAVVDAESGRMRVTESEIGTAAPPSATVEAQAPAASPLTDELSSKQTDTEKLEYLKNKLSGRTITVAELRGYCEALSFEDSRLQLIGQEQSSVSDRSNLSSLESLFAMKENKESFRKIVR